MEKFYVDTIETNHIGNHINKLYERIEAIEKRMDDFNIRNNEFYAEMKICIEFMNENIDFLSEVSHTHFWK
jgi:small-conductance mechanosensitive channel